MPRDLCPVGKNKFQTKNGKSQLKKKIWHLRRKKRAFSIFFYVFLVFDEENQMCLKLSCTYMVHI